MNDTILQKRFNDIVNNISFQYKQYIEVLQSHENKMISLSQSTSEEMGLYIIIINDFDNIFKYETNFVRRPLNLELSNSQGIEAKVLKQFFISEEKKFDNTKFENLIIIKKVMEIFNKELYTLLKSYL
jgi:hypothetical protein